MAASPLPSPSKVFIGTSVLFAGSRSPAGSARDLLVVGVLGQVALVLSPFVVEETRRNLSRKSPLALPFFEAFLSRGVMHSVEPPAALVQEVTAVVVPKDAEIVAGAIHAGALYLATFDRKDLLSKRHDILTAFGVTVATPNEVLASLDDPLPSP